MAAVGSILFNDGALSALDALRGSTRSAHAAESELSSGLAINEPADNPAGYIEAQGFTSQIGGQSQALSNTNQGLALLQTANGGLSQIEDTLRNMRAVALQAANGTLTASERNVLDGQVKQDLTLIDAMAGTTEFNDINLLNGTAGVLPIQTGAADGQTVPIDLGRDFGSTGIGQLATDTGSAAGGTVGITIASGAFQVDGAQIAGTFSTVGALAAAIQNSVDSNGGDLTVTVNASNELQFDNASGTPVTFSGSEAATLGLTTVPGYGVQSDTTYSAAGVAAAIGNSADAPRTGISGTVQFTVPSGSPGAGTWTGTPYHVEYSYATSNVDTNGETFVSFGFGQPAGYTGPSPVISFNPSPAEAGGNPLAFEIVDTQTVTVTVTGSNFAQLFGSNAVVISGSGGVVSRKMPAFLPAVGTDIRFVDEATAPTINGNAVNGELTDLGTATAAQQLAADLQTAANDPDLQVTYDASTDQLAFTNTGSAAITLNSGSMNLGLPTTIPGASAPADGTATSAPVVLASGPSSGWTLAAGDFSVNGTGIVGTFADAAALAAAVNAVGITDVSASTTPTGQLTLTGSSLNVEGSLAGNVPGGLGLATGWIQPAGDALDAISVKTVPLAQRALLQIDSAMQTVTSAQGQLGADGERLQSVANALSDSIEHQTSARSTVQDADIPKAAHALTEDQVLAQAGIATLKRSTALQKRYEQLLP